MSDSTKQWRAKKRELMTSNAQSVGYTPSALAARVFALVNEIDLDIAREVGAAVALERAYLNDATRAQMKPSERAMTRVSAEQHRKRARQMRKLAESLYLSAQSYDASMVR